jgi:DNA-binding transcriptional LysR family regulator
MAALPRSHALCRLATVPLEMLSDQPFILFPRHTAAGLFDLIIKMCGDNGFSPDIVQEASSWSTVVTLVGAGIGVTVAPSSAQLLCPPSVAFRTLTGADGEAELVLAFSEDTASPAAMRFAEVALEAVRVK